MLHMSIVETDGPSLLRHYSSLGIRIFINF